MKVLLTGATGFIGRSVLRALVDRGIDVVVMGRSRPDLPIEFVYADLLHDENIEEAIYSTQASHLMHFGWYTVHGQFWHSPLNGEWAKATKRLVKTFCDQGGRHVTIAGTCAEYDWSLGECFEDQTPISPHTIYGRAKANTHEKVSLICSKQNVPFLWGRIFIPYGLGENRARLIPSLIDAMSGRRPPFSIKTGVYRDFMHVSDVASAFISLMQNGLAGAYNVSSGEATQLGALIILIAELTQSDPKPFLDHAVTHTDEPALLIGNSAKLNRTSWRPQYNLRTGLEAVLASQSAKQSAGEIL